jgi:hypothetical protein
MVGPFNVAYRTAFVRTSLGINNYYDWASICSDTPDVRVKMSFHNKKSAAKLAALSFQNRKAYA